jgi:hypothetical protein
VETRCAGAAPDLSNVCAAREEEMGKNEIEFWLVLLKKIHLRAEYSGIDRR